VPAAKAKVCGLDLRLLQALAPPLAFRRETLKMHVERLLQTLPLRQSWTRQYVGISPVLDAEERAVLSGAWSDGGGFGGFDKGASLILGSIRVSTDSIFALE